MQAQLQIRAKSTLAQRSSITPVRTSLLQRKCACGGTPGVDGECAECRRKRGLGLQAKLRVNSPGDRYEREADWIAAQVTKPSVQLKRPGLLGHTVQHTEAGPGALVEASPIVYEVLQSSGQQLDAETRAYMEPRFGHDFSRVRVHTDARAAESARAVNALAYTVGRDIVLDDEAHDLRSMRWRTLLAHELTHVIQQGEGHRANTARGNIVSTDVVEAETQRVAFGSVPTGIVHRQLRERVATEAIKQVGKRAVVVGGAALAAIAAGLTVLLWPSEIAPEPRTEPVPKPPGPKRRERECYGGWGPPAGGDTIHDEYARHVALRYGNPTYATLNFYMGKDGLGADFDHYNEDSNQFFEAKTRHEILLREWAVSQPLVLARLYEQAERQFAAIVECAPLYPPPRLIWFFDDLDVAEVASQYLGGVVDEVRHEPRPTGTKPVEKKKRRESAKR